MLPRIGAPLTLAELRAGLLSPHTAAGTLPRGETLRALAWGGGLGVLGVMTGYAAFVAWVAQDKEGHWLALLAVVLVVAVVAAIGEQARHIIAHGARAPRHGGLVATLASTLAAFAIVLLFEISNTAWHKGGEKLRETLEDMLGLAHEPFERKLRLASIIVVWIASGALVAIVLVRRILSLQPAPAPWGFAPFVDAWRDGWRRLSATALEWLWKNRTLRAGVLAALVAAGVCAALLVAAMIVIDCLYSTYLLLADYAYWETKLRDRVRSGGFVAFLCYPARALDFAVGSTVAQSWFLQGWLLLAYGLAMLWRFSRTRAVVMLLILAMVVVPPVATGWLEVPRLSLVYALLWAIPAFALGAISPYLREFKPTQWGRIACIVALAFVLLAMLQGAIAKPALQPMTVAGAGLALLIGLLLLFAPPTRDYLPLTALVCGLLSYAAAGLLAFPTYVVERVVFLGAPAAKPEDRLCLAEATGKESQSETKEKQSKKEEKQPQQERCVETETLDPKPAAFVLTWKVRDREIEERFEKVKARIPSALLKQVGDWDIGTEIFDDVKGIASMKRLHARWEQTHALRTYVDYLRYPGVYSFLFGSYLYRFNLPPSILFQDKRVASLYQRPVLAGEALTSFEKIIDGVCPPNFSEEACLAWRTLGRPKRGLCPGRSRIECLVALADPAKKQEASELGWTLPQLQEWLGKVAEALEADLRSRWVDEAIGFRLHAALSGMIGFFLALAALIAWQIRNAHEGVGQAPGGAPH